MNDHDFLTLRLIHLNASEKRTLDLEGLFFAFPKEGSGLWSAGQTTLRMAPGDALVVADAIGVQLTPAKGGELVFWSFSLSMEHLLPLFKGKEISLLQRVLQGLKKAKLFPAVTPVAQRCRQLIEDAPPQFNLDHRSQLLRIAASLLTEEFKSAHSQRTDCLSVEDRVLDLFEKLTAEQILSLSVGELALKFGCSRRHLNRLFHQFFGYSVAALRMEMRLLKAISLLRVANTKIINVAEQCGFNHLGLFNTCFKRRFGVSPGAWRKQAPERENLTASAKAEQADCPLHAKGLCPLMSGSETTVQSARKDPAVQSALAATLLGCKSLDLKNQTPVPKDHKPLNRFSSELGGSAPS